MDLSEVSVKAFFDDALKRHKSSSTTLKQPTFKMRLDFEWKINDIQTKTSSSFREILQNFIELRFIYTSDF